MAATPARTLAVSCLFATHSSSVVIKTLSRNNIHQRFWWQWVVKWKELKNSACEEQERENEQDYHLCI